MLSATWVSRMYEGPPLYDVVHAHTPDWRAWEWFASVYTYTLAAAAVPHVGARHVEAYFLAMLLRSVSILLTRLPDPSGVFPRGPRVPFLGRTYNDLMPSGHSILLATAATAMGTPLAWLFAVWGGVLLVVTRLHYTVDVFWGLLLPVLLEARIAGDVAA